MHLYKFLIYFYYNY